MFRFEGLEIWKRSADLAYDLFAVADELEGRKLFRFAEQLRSAALSIPNNIAEGSGSSSKREFFQFLNISHRSAFECASMMILFRRKALVPEADALRLCEALDEVCRMITAFRRSIST